MWTSTLTLDPKRVVLAKLLALVYPDIYYSSLSPLQVQNVPRPQLLAPGWVRVRNRLAGICGSDLHLVYADGDFRVAPAALPGHKQTYPGHEVVGEVIEIGDDVQHLAVGDRVVLQSGPNCLSTGVLYPCRACANANFNLCEYGPLPEPLTIGGGWSEEMLLHEQQLFSLPEELSDEQAVMLEPTAVALHAVLRHLPKPGEEVLIVGAGTIGLLTLQVIRALVPDAQVSVLARHGFQIEQATRMGAAHIIYPQDSYNGVQKVTKARLYHGMLGNQVLLGGYDVIFDTVGQRSTLHHSLRWARAQATIVLVGLSLHLMHIDLSPIWHQEINLLGTTSHGTERWPLGSNQQRSTFSLACELMRQGRIHPEQLITHHFALPNYKDALLTATTKARSRAIKVIFDYSLLPASVVPTIRASGRLQPTTLVTPAITKPLVELPSPAQPQEEPPLLPRLPQTPDAPARPEPAPEPEPAKLATWQYAAFEQADGLQQTMQAFPALNRSRPVPHTPVIDAHDEQSAANEAMPTSVPPSRQEPETEQVANVMSASDAEAVAFDTPLPAAPATLNRSDTPTEPVPVVSGLLPHSAIPVTPPATPANAVADMPEVIPITTLPAEPQGTLPVTGEDSIAQEQPGEVVLPSTSEDDAPNPALAQALVETKEYSDTLPAVGDTPTTKVQSRPRHRKKSA